MPKLKKIVVIIFFTVSLNAQPRNFTSNPVAELINKMITNEAWDQIYHYSKKNLRKHKDFNSDIKKTIQFIKKQKCTTLIDSTLLYHKTYKTLYPKIVEIISLDLSISIPILIQYLNNDAATRLCLGSDDWDELPFYLSISDVAIELIEIISSSNEILIKCPNCSETFSPKKASLFENREVIKYIWIITT